MPYLQSVRRSVSFSSRFSYDFDLDWFAPVGGRFEHGIDPSECGRRVQHLADLLVFADQYAPRAILGGIADMDQDAVELRHIE